MICCTNPPHLTVNLQPHRTRSTGPTIISSSARRGEEGRGGERRGEERRGGAPWCSCTSSS